MKLILRALISLTGISCVSENTPKTFNDNPEATIVSHSDGATVLEGYPIEFRAQVSDSNHSADELEAAWYVDNVQVCDWTAPSSSGESACWTALTLNNNGIVVEVRDPEGAGGRDEIALSVSPTQSPTAGILSPILGSTYYADQPILFKALIADAEDPSEELTAVWESSLEGDLPLEPLADSVGEIEDYHWLSEGSHAIKLHVTDRSGKTSTESLVIQVQASNTLPNCGIDSPLSGSVHMSGEPIAFTGFATDNDLQNSLLTTTWESDIDGLLNASSPATDGTLSFVSDSLSLGYHTITLSAADEANGLCATFVTLEIQDGPSTTAPSQPVVAISPANPTEGDDLFCEIVFAGIDPDGQPVTHQFDWTVDGLPHSGPTLSQAESNDTIPYTETSQGQNWACTVTPNDGSETGPSAFSSVAVGGACGLTPCDFNLDLGGSHSLDMVLIPAGTDPLGRYSLSDDFHLMTTTVTQSQFLHIMGYDSLISNFGVHGSGINHPAYYVSWYMAADFANLITQRHNTVYGTSLSECYSCTDSGDPDAVVCTETMPHHDCDGYVIPSEAQWEYAARNGTTKAFWTGQGPDLGGDYSMTSCSVLVTIDDGVNTPYLDDYGWFCGNANDMVYEVADKVPNGHGLYDMHGNVWEWTTDWSGCSYPVSGTDPVCTAPSSGKRRKGGSFRSTPDTMCNTAQGGSAPYGRPDDTGFRLARGL